VAPALLLQVRQNVEAVVAAAVQHVPKKWANVQGVFVKTAESVALPVYQSLPDAPTKIGA
jgi:ribosome biogenesis protein UTP30